MHLPCDWGGQWSQNWLRDNRKVPVFMREVHPEIPMSVRYPFEEVHQGLFTSSVCWAIALAIFEGWPKIRVFGVELTDKEYQGQAAGFAYWKGYADGIGIELNIECESVFNVPLYGSYPLEG